MGTDPSVLYRMPWIAIGHYDIERKAKTQGDILGSIYTHLNAGIAVITPAWRIKELLMRDDVVEARESKRRKAEDAEVAASDSEIMPLASLGIQVSIPQDG